MKRRIFALLLVFSLLFSCFVALASCDGEQPNPSGPPSGPVDGGDSGNGGTSTTGHQHTDADSNEVCDECSESVVVIVDFYVINDLHGKFCDTDTQPGVDELSTYLKQARETDDHVVLLSSGDMWQGSAESNLTGGILMTEWMNELDFVSMTLGNHEYDWGEEAIRNNLAVAEFPFLAINIYDVATGERADYCAPSVMIERGDIQIGIIGAIGDCYSSIAADMVENVEFKVGADLTALVKEESTRLREAGADLIVYSLHDGYGSSSDGVQDVYPTRLSSYYDGSLSDGYVDLVFESHTHQRYTLVDSKDVYHLQGGGENYGLSHVEIKVNTVTGKNTVTDAGIVRSAVYAQQEDDPATEALEDKYAETIEYAYGVLGRVDATVSSGRLADLMAEYYLQIAEARWGEQYDIVLGGGYIKTRTPYDLPRGEVTYADVLSLFPFDNRLVLCEISGAKLLSQFINTTNSAYHIALSEYGESILGNISPNGTYYIMTDSYSSTYAPNGLTEVAEYDNGVFARDLLAQAIKNGDFTVEHGDITLTPITEALTIGQGIPQGQITNDYYYVKGTIVDDPQATYGNLYLTDGAGNTIYVYGLYDQAGNRYDAMTDKPQKGDEVVLFAQIMHYVNPNTGEEKIELKDATLIEIVEE
ncbi:MAG: bifunctional metallophosphatase/5'-nucleotidase [Clostridia bacterium]|nr:bifunctional metallophosphatase/5'-nucleotidase [Clostridia bacterium]